MNDYINILVNSNNSITYTTDVPLIYQGSTGNIYLNIEFEKEMPNNAVVELLFRRSDGEMTPWLLTKPIGGTYQFKMESSWFTEKSGSLTYTVKVTRVISDVEKEQLLTSYDVLPILPTQNALFVPAPTKPSNYNIITNRLTSAENTITELQESNFVKEIKTGSVVTKDKTSIVYKTFDDEEKVVDITLPNELATEEEVNNKINNKFDEVNPVTDIATSNNDLEIVVDKYGSPNKTIKIKADNFVTKDKFEADINNITDDLVKYSTLENVDTAVLEVAHAESAELAYKDGNGNVITETYVPLNGGTVFSPINVNSRLKITNNLQIGKHLMLNPIGDWKEFDTSNIVPNVSLYNSEPYGQLQIGVTKNGVSGNIILSPALGELQYSNKDTDHEAKTIKLDDISLSNKTNTFTEPQIFTERVDILNSNGTYDSIKHINNNFLISSSDGTNLMDIDSGLQTVSFFNKDVVFIQDVNNVFDELNSRVVFVEFSLQGATYRLPVNAQQQILAFNDNKPYAVMINTYNSTATVAYASAITDGEEWTPIISNITTIKVGDL